MVRKTLLDREREREREKYDVTWVGMHLHLNGLRYSKHIPRTHN